MIEAIELPITKDSRRQIEEARKAYDALTPEQKKLVPNLSRLEVSERKLQALEEKPKPTEKPADPTTKPTTKPGSSSGGKGPSKTNANTGDRMNLALAVTSMVLSGAGLAAAPFLKRKH